MRIWLLPRQGYWSLTCGPALPRSPYVVLDSGLTPLGLTSLSLMGFEDPNEILYFEWGENKVTIQHATGSRPLLTSGLVALFLIKT